MRKTISSKFKAKHLVELLEKLTPEQLEEPLVFYIEYDYYIDNLVTGVRSFDGNEVLNRQ